MPKGRKHLTKEDNTWLATCFAKDPRSTLEIGKAECEWDHICPTEDMAKLLGALHVLVKHPDKYREMTGKDPDKAAYVYSKQIDALRRYL